MLNLVAVGSKVVELFQIEEYTAEAFQKGMRAAGWECEGNDLIHKTIKRFPNGAELDSVDKRVGMCNVCVETEMKYSEYKKNYAGCYTKKDSYNKETKTIVVYVPC